MDTKKKYSIKEISRLLNIPKATIRYWDSEGLISPERNQQNEYREFSMAVAMELSNISFYRNIDIPVKELKRMLNSDISVQEKLLEDAQMQLENEMEELKRQAERIQRQKYALAEIQRLKRCGMMAAQPGFTRVAAFSYQKEEHWQRITENPGDFVLVFENKSDVEYQYGIGYRADEQPSEGESVIWTMGNALIYEGLLITDNRDEAKNNLSVLREQLAKKGYLTGKVVAQYLTSGVRGTNELLDYYKTWIELAI